MRYQLTSKAFTLAELLIALAILGVIATFTIPKILDSGSNSKHNSIVKEAISMMSGAFQQLKLDTTVNGNTSINELLPYINYVSIDSSGTAIDLMNTLGAATCDVTFPCLKLHNGALLKFRNGNYFGDTALTSAIWFHIDPDGQYGGSTTGPSKSTSAWIYINGRVRTFDTIEPNTYTVNAAPSSQNPVASSKPEYFSWGN